MFPSGTGWTTSARNLQPIWRSSSGETFSANGCVLKFAGFWRASTSPPMLPALVDEAAELNRIRTNPNRREAEGFARDLTCDALTTQAARLLESLAE